MYHIMHLVFKFANTGGLLSRLPKTLILNLATDHFTCPGTPIGFYRICLILGPTIGVWSTEKREKKKNLFKYGSVIKGILTP